MAAVALWLTGSSSSWRKAAGATSHVGRPYSGPLLRVGGSVCHRGLGALSLTNLSSESRVSAMARRSLSVRR